MNTKKQVIIIILILVTNVSLAQTQRSSQFLALARTCYLHSLDSENDGVRNSTIFLVVQFKKQHPEENFKSFVKKFKNISQTDPIIQNRLHAYLALVCLEQPDLMESINPSKFEDPKMFFDTIYNALSVRQYAMQ